MAIRNLSDIAAIEAAPLSERALPESSYAALVESAKRIPDAKALSFFLSADRLDETHVWTYAELVADITRAANLFTLLGVATDRPAAFVLPNLPETHFTIWGGEAAGAALAINPMLEPKLIANLLRSARALVLVTLAPALSPTTWTALAAELASLPDLRTVAFVDMADYVDDEKREAARASIEAAAGAGLKVLNLRQAMREQPSDRLTSGRGIRADDISSYFCTGGTTGAPKIAVDASERGFRRVGLVASDGDRRFAANRSLRLAPVSRKRSTRHRPAAVDARRPRPPRHAGRLSGKERHRPLLGDRRSLRRLDVLGRADALRRLARDCDRRQQSLQPEICGLRGGAYAGGADTSVRSEDGGEDPRRIRAY